MTELLPGPEDPGKHLFEISPGRPERLHPCAGAGPGGPGGVLPQLWPGKGHLYNTPLCTDVSSVYKHNSEISRPYCKFGENFENSINYLGS